MLDADPLEVYAPRTFYRVVSHVETDDLARRIPTFIERCEGPWESVMATEVIMPVLGMTMESRIIGSG